MKKLLKFTLIFVAVLLALFLGFTVYYLTATAGAKLDLTGFVNSNSTITVYDDKNNVFSEQSNSIELVKISDLPDHVKNAFIAIEDKRFYSHKGVDYKGMARAFFNNIITFSFKEGASTITQQLIKNTHLSNEKTLNRKLTEIKLAKQLEKKYTKDQILETYLNTIYFGDNCFGIKKASKHYFGKSPSDLSVSESATLAGLVKSPSNYSPVTNYDKAVKRRNVVLKEMKEQKYISESEYNDAINEKLNLSKDNGGYNYLYSYYLNNELNDFLDVHGAYGKKYKVYTYLNSKVQENTEKIMAQCSVNAYKSVIITDSKSHLISYVSTCGDVNRQMGSTIKPLAVYAPAIEENVYDECTLIDDVKTDFGGYSPSNYNDIYYGKISVKESLAKSLNVCSVKILNSTGMEKSLSYVKKAGIPISDKDKNLSVALGATEKGAKLSEIVSAYNVFSNSGKFNKLSAIKEITDENGKSLYKNPYKNTAVFSDDTVEIMNDMNRYTVTDGTLKKLSLIDAEICGKTGTVGTKNGNTDAYSISYSNDFTVGVWLGNKDGSLLDNNVTGGTTPSIMAKDLWENLYNESSPTKLKKSGKVSKVGIDKLSYEEDGLVLLADENAPEKYVYNSLFKDSHIPNRRSTRFSNPECESIKTSVKEKGFSIELCLSELYNYKIYRDDGKNKYEIYDSVKNGRKLKITDNDIKPGKTYQYSVLPYYKNNDKTFFGKEKYSEKVKSPKINFDDGWIYDIYF